MYKNSLIRSYRYGDEKKMDDLFNVVFKKERDLKTWTWKFSDNPNHAEHVIAVAESGGEIIGMYPSWGRYYKFGNDLILTLQPIENCVHPDFRGGGRVFIRLYHEWRKRAVNLGAKFAFGFPTDDHFKIGRRLLGYRVLFSVPVLYKRLNLRLAFRNRFHNIFLERLVYLISNRLYRMLYSISGMMSQKRFEIERVYSFDKGYDRFWSKVSQRYGIIGIRDSAYLNWRYVQHSKKGYAIFRSIRDGEVQGYIILKVLDIDPGERVGFIVDLLAIDNEDLIGGLLTAGITYLLSEEVDCVKILIENNLIYNYMIKNGFKKRDEPLPVAYELYDKNIDEAFLRNRDNWFLSYSDTDLID